MRRLVGTYLLVCALLFAAWQASLRAQDMTLMGAGSSGAAPFTGPGDTSAFKMWWGFRAFSVADRGNRLIQVCNVSDVTCTDLSSNAVTGNLTIPLIGGSDCTSVTCTIKFMYDRSGAAFCTGAVACDMNQGTIATRPTLVVNCQNGHPCAACSGSQQMVTTAVLGSTQTQPFSVSLAAKRTSGAGFSTAISGTSTGSMQTGFSNSANNALMFAGTVVPLAATDNAYHAFNVVYNGASSDFFLDGASNTVSAGANTITNAETPFLCSANGANFLAGNFLEGGIAGGAFSSGAKTALNANQRLYWGF